MFSPYPNATAIDIAKACEVAAVVCEVPSAKVIPLVLKTNPARFVVPVKFLVPLIVTVLVKLAVPEYVLSPEKVISVEGSKTAAFNCTTASITSVADAIVPEAPVTLAISPTSALNELNVVRNVSKVFDANTLLSAILFLY
jgi:hypothetical protein